MESKRQQKFSRLLQRDLGEIFQQDVKHIFKNQFITVTQVRVTPDLGTARVYLSFLQDKNKEEVLEKVQDQTKTVRQILAQRIKNQVKAIPELHFYLDDTADYAAKMDKLFDELDIPPETEEEE